MAYHKDFKQGLDSSYTFCIPSHIISNWLTHCIKMLSLIYILSQKTYLDYMYLLKKSVDF